MSPYILYFEEREFRWVFYHVFAPGQVSRSQESGVMQKTWLPSVLEANFVHDVHNI